jgi:hypothetical protein
MAANNAHRPSAEACALASCQPGRTTTLGANRPFVESRRPLKTSSSSLFSSRQRSRRPRALTSSSSACWNLSRSIKLSAGPDCAAPRRGRRKNASSSQSVCLDGEASGRGGCCACALLASCYLAAAAAEATGATEAPAGQSFTQTIGPLGDRARPALDTKLRRLQTSREPRRPRRPRRSSSSRRGLPLTWVVLGRCVRCVC